MPRPFHFEIPADQPERAIRFYQSVFDWKIRKWDGPADYWTIETGPASEPGIDGGILQKRDPAQPCVNTIAIADLDAAVRAVEAAGGKSVLPKMPVQGIGWLAYCKDTEGNMFGLMQMDASAK